MLKEKVERMGAKRDAKRAKLNVWHRMMLEILKDGKCDSETLVDKMIERKAYHSRGTLKGYISALSGWGMIEEIETERVRDSGGRMTVRVWRLPEGRDQSEIPPTDGGVAEKPKKNKPRQLMNVWHRTMLEVLKEGHLSKPELIQKTKERGAYQSMETLRSYVTDLKNFGLIEEVDDIRAADKNGRMTIRFLKLVEGAESSPTAARVNQPTEGAK